MKLSETEHEIYVRFNQSNSVWVEFAFVKSEERFLAFRCNAFCEDPAWKNLDAATIEEAFNSASLTPIRVRHSTA